MKGRYLTVVNNALIPCFFFVDCLLLAGIIVLWYFMVFWEGEGFYMNRPYIPCADIAHYSYPNLETKVPDVVIYVLCFALPPVVILFGEAALAVFQLQGYESPVFEKTVITFDVKFHPIVRRTLRFIGIFALGGFVTWIVSRAAQLMLGYPAPYFFSVCLLPSTQCTGTDLVTQLPECTGTNDNLARQSFPSVFAALSAYSAIYTGVYVSKVFVIKSAKTLQPLIVLSFLALSLLTGLEQLAFYKASWYDVIAGWLLGALIAAYLSVVVLNSFLGHIFHFQPRLVGMPRPKTPEMNGNGRQYSERPAYIDRNVEWKKKWLANSVPNDKNTSESSLKRPMSYRYRTDNRRM
ncbi:phospholipid phosphatase-related protein type 5-like isoform X1 [Patiria miniata]|uniref:Phosphatidic acid phosphatase type 2/haloperoxidase domain-containing protein n=1 Tax=Patiria miniata TaxID=46514 RepID=A0A913ZDE7_PATMI|nr:phospholipid phosphatase-related protein type 5-like isoform X1 [Patiria miniata]XP_038049535.1 phospholipid phosphatase-related protein type 5-like isoform X1 [Patiria miniata]